MNAEQLHGLLRRLSAAHAELGTLAKLEEVRAALDGIANNPGNGDFQNQFRQRTTELVGLFTDERLNVFTVRELALIDELSLDVLVGNKAEARLKRAISGQDLTPRVAHDKVRRLHKQLNQRLSSIQTIVSGLDGLGIGDGAPLPGEVEVGLYVPRGDNEMRLDALLEEAEQFNKLLVVANELVTGSSDSPRVRFLTSSDFGFLVDAAPEVIDLIVSCLERGLALYVGWLGALALHRQLAERGHGEETLKQLQAHEDAKLEGDLHAEVKGIVQSKSVQDDAGRKHELTNHLVSHVRVFLQKTQKGHYVDVRVGAIPEPNPNSEDEGPTQQQISLLQRIETMSHRLHLLEQTQRTSLSLPPPERTDETESD